MLRRSRAGRLVIAAAATMLGAATSRAQQPQAPQPEKGPKVGEMAPDFTFTGVTRWGNIGQPMSLASLRGQTVVLAFFVKARTRG
jgi:hypothetical protein